MDLRDTCEDPRGQGPRKPSQKGVEVLAVKVLAASARANLHRLVDSAL